MEKTGVLQILKCSTEVFHGKNGGFFKEKQGFYNSISIFIVKKREVLQNLRILVFLALFKIKIPLFFLYFSCKIYVFLAIPEVLQNLRFLKDFQVVSNKGKTVVFQCLCAI